MSYHSRQPSVASSLLSSSTFNTSQINKIGPWKLGKTLGRGSTGRVLLAENLNTQQKAAVKVVSKSVLNTLETGNNNNGDEKGRDAAGLAYGIEREIIIMKLLNHPNVLRLYDVWETSKSLYLILEYVEGGELFDLLVEKGPLSEFEAIGYFRQIILGASYCHALGICHRDLKPENLLLDHNLNIKIADFGMAALENNDRLLETSCGSPHYAAPEIVSGKHYHGFESDVWSCGVILFALLTGRLPFDDENIRNLLLKVQNGSFEMPIEISIEAKDLISKMLTVEPNKRIKTFEILNHPLLTKYPLNNKDLKTLNNLPLPNTYLQKIKSIDEIDEQILNNLVILWHGRNKDEIIKNLLKNESTTEKIFYFLLLRYRHNQSNASASLVRSLSIAKSVNHHGLNHQQTPSPYSSSSGSSSSYHNNINNINNRTPNKKSNNRRSIISVSSSHRKSVSFNTKSNNRRSIKDLTDLNQQQPPVPKNLIDEFQKSNPNPISIPIQSSNGITKSTSKRRSMRTSILPSKRNSVTSKLIAVYAKLANDNDWEYIDKEAKRTSSNFATLCDEIFDHEKYEKIRQEKLKAQERKRLIEEKERLEREQAELAEQQRLEEEAEAAAAAAAAAAQREEEKQQDDSLNDDSNNDEEQPKLKNNKLRSVSGPNGRTSQLLDKDEISKIQQRAISHPLESRPKSRLDPGLNFQQENWRTSKFYYDENDSIVQAIRRSKFLGSKFELDLKRQSTMKQQKQVSKNFNDEKITKKSIIKNEDDDDEKEEDDDHDQPIKRDGNKKDKLEKFDGPKTIAEVKIPQVTRKSRHFSNSNKRLSVLSIYSTKNSYTNLASKLKELDDEEAEKSNKKTSQKILSSSPLIQQQENSSKSYSKTSGLRLSYADRLTALQESQEETSNSTPKVQEIDEDEIDKFNKNHHEDSMYKGLNIPDLPDHYEPIKNKFSSSARATTTTRPKSKIQIHKDDVEDDEEQEESKPLPKPKRNAPTAPKVNPSISTTKVTKEPLNDVTNDVTNKRNTSGASGFFRKWSLGKKDVQEIDSNIQQQPQQQYQSFFSRFSSNSTPVQGKTLNTVYETNEMYQTLRRLLLGWNDYGLKNIETNDETLTISGEISKNNIMRLNGTKFKLNVEKFGKKGSCIKFFKLKGSSKSFKTLINEIERILNRENVLAFSN